MGNWAEGNVRKQLHGLHCVRNAYHESEGKRTLHGLRRVRNAYHESDGKATRAVFHHTFAHYRAILLPRTFVHTLPASTKQRPRPPLSMNATRVGAIVVCLNSVVGPNAFTGTYMQYRFLTK